MADDPETLLRIYLNDQLAAATGTLALARRTLGSNPDGELGRFLAGLVRELAEDREALERVAAALGIRRNAAKEAAVRAAVRAGRLKLNGRLRGYSDLSRVLELEGLALAAEAAGARWASLREAGRRLPVDPDELARLAARRRAEVERHRLDAVRKAFGTSG